MNQCHATVHWQELALMRRCVLPDGHNGYHQDGVWWFWEGLRVPRDDDRRDQAERVADDVIGRAR